MPHFVIDCSERILLTHCEEKINQEIHKVAHLTGLFDEKDIKVRVNPFKHYSVANRKEDFIHVFANVMEGRTTTQKAELSKAVVAKLNDLFPSVENIAMNVRGFEKATYCNKSML
ncbi:5-carboxymethyl-2-hydroxymuconate Delta-isomerase [Marinomonas sp. 15G1-11]|uniref:5-carboxymethyl-2-hydroxymuconate Delta-isomerase n=1 Tax=Marinomonas phaeophyticola TaxID=3004091 RepID=A0ABT4JV59_9GAMM|nr:5-carboxymethyl-2-hydroxymuconate Delta-isomerase [Marinomonas sp. 15G1-11]MCZ2722274.1 5-carboxymethyl-2-hydroxymuconate Delta-isomerase [Marinomonas sp. 15G1-11]